MRWCLCLPVLALLLEFGQGLLFQFRRQQFIGGLLGVFICLPDPTDIVRGVPLRDMGNPYEMYLKVFHNSAVDYIQRVMMISRVIQGSRSPRFPVRCWSYEKA